MEKAGKLTAGKKLADGEGRVLRRSGGQLSISDGPYTESKEVVGGLFEIVADNYDQAVEIANQCPHLEFGIVEVREIEIGGEYEARQRERIKSIKERRDQEKVTNTLEALKTAMRTGENAFPHLIEAVESYATLGEICDAMREVWGAYRETAVL